MEMQDPQSQNSGAGVSPLTAQEKRFLLEVARCALVDASQGLDSGPVPGVPARLLQPKACFVTLTQAGALRGCIGHVVARAPLYQAVIESARGAATRDPRFAPVRTDEVAGIHIEISVLTEPRRLGFHSPEELLSLLQPHRDGVTLQVGAHWATFLPKVWQQVPDRVELLDRLARKAGCPADAWRGKDTVVSVYEADSFGEE